MPTTWPSRLTSGPPGVAGVDRSVHLDQAVEDLAAVRYLEGPSQAGDDPRADRRVQAEGVAHGERVAADADRVRVAERRRHEVRRQLARPEHGDVVVRLADRDLGARLRPVGERQRDRVGARDHVETGEDVPGPVDDHAGPQAAGLSPVRARRSRLDQDQGGCAPRRTPAARWPVTASATRAPGPRSRRPRAGSAGGEG